jgi:hypothetical protein
MIRGALAWITANLMFKQVSAERCCKHITRLLWESTTDMSTTVRLQWAEVISEDIPHCRQ